MNKKILIVDNEPAIGKLLMYQLQAYNYITSYVADGLQAIERIEHERPDLVLLDVMMPSISGWDVCRQIRAHSTVPVIMLTAKSADDDIVTGLTAGADDYVAKPFHLGQLQARIEAVLRRSRTGSRPRFSPAHSEPEQPMVGGKDDVALLRQLNAQPLYTTAEEAPMPASASDTPEKLGERLHSARISRGIPLMLAARDCNTRWEFLQAIEQGNHTYVPSQQLRVVLRQYVQYLDIPWQSSPQPSRHLPSRLQYVTLLTMVLLVIALGLYLF